MGCGSEPVGRRCPESSPKVSPMTRGTCGALCSKWILPKKKALALNPTCELSTVNAHPLSAKHADTPLAGTEGLSRTRSPGG